MVRKPDIQYVRYYTDGSSARVLRPILAAPRTKLPKPRRKKVRLIRLDLLAYTGIALSVVMLVLMVINCFQLRQLQVKTDRMNSYVDVLKEENARLSDTYHSGYDLEDVRTKAEAMGMVPIDQVQRITVSVAKPEIQTKEPEMNLWAFLTDMFE